MGSCEGVHGEGVATQGHPISVPPMQVLVQVLGSKSGSLSVGVGLHQDALCYQSCSSFSWKGYQGLVVGGNVSLLFANDVVLMAPSVCDLQHSLDQFTAECEAAGMRISLSKSEAMVLSILMCSYIDMLSRDV